MKALASLQARLVALVTGLVMITWVAVAGWTWVQARHELDELLDAHLAQAAALLVGQQLPEFDEEHAVDAPLLHRYAPRVAFQVYQEGRLHLRSSNAPLAPMLPGAALATPGGFHDVELQGQAWRVFDTAIGEVRVVVGERTTSRTAILRAVMRGTLQPLLLALPVLALAVWWGVAGGLAPVRRLAALLQRRQPADLTPLALVRAPAELEPLVDALNGQFRRLAELLDGERRFTADAAHELRTPIAAIRAQAQVAFTESDDDRRRTALRFTIEGCDRAAHVVDQLLTLARLEAEPALQPQRTDLRRVARDVLADMAAPVHARGQTVSLEAGPDDFHVRASETLMKVLLRNLVDNALRYSPPGTGVDVRLRREQGQVRLAVLDSGPGLQDDELARLGERFFRGGASTAAGSGLGWSIARRVAAAHDGSLVAGNRPEGGLAVTVSLPGAG